MTKKNLKGNCISTFPGQVGSEAMPQGMRGCFDWQAASFCVLGDNVLDRPWCQSHFFAALPGIYLTTMGDKKGVKMVSARL